MEEHEEICDLPLISIILFLFLHVFLLSKALHFDYTQMYIMNQRKAALKKKIFILETFVFSIDKAHF